MRFGPVTRNFAKHLDIKSLKLLDNYASFNPSPLSIQKFLDFGRTATEEESFHFLKKELPVRLSNIMKEINLLPSTLLIMPSIQKVQVQYSDTFKSLAQFDHQPADPETLAAFIKTLMEVQDINRDIVKIMAQGVLELKDSHEVDKATDNSINYFLERFYMSRISMRMLMNQHVLLFEQDAVRSDRRVGIIDLKCNIAAVVKQAYEEAAILCEKNYSIAPEIHVQVHEQLRFPAEDGSSRRIVKERTKGPLFLVYPPTHLKHIFIELLKNAMRASVELSRDKGSLQVPDIDVLIAKGKEDVAIKISDKGGGIPRKVMDGMFRYGVSTAPRPSYKPTEATAFAGYGYGLPISRLYARYFHGDLIVNSYDGYGTDAIIYLKNLPTDANELLPIFNKTSTKQYKQTTPTADWTDPNNHMSSIAHYKYTRQFSTAQTAATKMIST